MTKKLSHVSVSKQVGKTSKHSAKQLVETLKSSQKTKSLRIFIIYIFLYIYMLFFQTRFFFGHTFIFRVHFLYLCE